MPTYVYRCQTCRHEQDGVRSIAERDEAPLCSVCLVRTERRITATMVAVPFKDYVTPCYDKETGKRMRITSSEEHRAFLARNGLEEVGNDKSIAPKSPEEVAHIRGQKLKEQNADFNFNNETHEATI